MKSGKVSNIFFGEPFSETREIEQDAFSLEIRRTMEFYL